MNKPSFILSDNSVAEFKGQIVDMFEDFLDQEGVWSEDPERDAYNKAAGYEEGENQVNLFGDRYSRIADAIGYVVELLELNKGNRITDSKLMDFVARYIVSVFNRVGFEEIVDDSNVFPLDFDVENNLEKAVIVRFEEWGLYLSPKEENEYRDEMIGKIIRAAVGW